jgi:hypothetical protein
MLYIDTGVDLVEGGEAAGTAIGEAYREKDYHQPSDDFRADWDFTGMASDVNADFEVISRYANSKEWPQWYEGNEFRATREASLKGK